MKMKTAAVLGAGAVGSYFIWGLQPKLGDDFWIIADGSRKERLERQGVTINGTTLYPRVKTPAESRGVDLLLVATKAGALPGALEDIAAAVGEHTAVMTLLNGVTSEELAGRRIGMEHMVHSMMKIASRRTAEGTAFDAEATPGLFYGEPASPVPTERMRAIEELLSGTGLHCQMRPDILTVMWEKFIYNVSANLPQAILGCGIGAYEDSLYAAEIVENLRKEAEAVARARGIRLPEGSDIGKRGSASKSARYSTLQDLDAGRHTEVDIFAGAVVEMGRELGIETPWCRFAWAAIHALEEKNDGKFNYD